MKMPPTELEFIQFQGGLDLVTPVLFTPPGRCRDAQNVEIDVFGGYRVTDGYERYDGRVKPSDAVYYLIPANVTGVIAVGNTITGLSSGATGVVIAVALDRIVFTKKTGNFLPSEDIQVGGTTRATSNGEQQNSGGDTSQQRAQYQNLAADAYRSDILAVPGSGPIRGLKLFQGALYAFRNNVGATACVMHKATTGGWSAVDLGEQVAFSNANTSVGEGDTLTQGGVTATIKRVVVEEGTLASGVNSGRLIISGRSGGNFAAGAATSTGGGMLTLSAAQSAITLLPGGRFRFTAYNFGAGRRLYGCDGVNTAFEFDGTVFAPIRTGMTVDAPAHIAAHRSHLFLAFGHSLQHSSIGDPYQWTPVTGAAELNAGDTITNLLPMPGDNVAGGAMAVFTRNATPMLYGNSTADWQMPALRHDAGALAHTAQFINTAYCLDDRGVTSLATTDAFGNFASASLSELIRPFITQYKAQALDSAVVREKNQYRILFSGGVVLTMTLQGNKIAGFMPLRLAHSMSLMESGEDSSGNELVFYGDVDGYVYQSGVGTSFDGYPIEWYVNLAFNHTKSPRLLKQYRKVVFEVGGAGFAQLYFSADLNYASQETPQILQSEVSFGTAELGSGNWDAATWDVSTWDGVTLLPAELGINGIAQNMAMKIAGSSDYHAALTLSGALLHYTPRRLMR